MFLISAQIAGDLYRGQLAATDTVCLRGIDIKVIYINLSQEAPLRAGAHVPPKMRNAHLRNDS